MKHRHNASHNAVLGTRPVRRRTRSTPSIGYVDPLDEDRPSDMAITLTERQLLRLVFVATETGVRFEREGVALDPLAWLFSPREIFKGRSAIDACQDRDSFIKAIVLHGLSLGFDADPDEIDGLLAPDANCFEDGSVVPQRGAAEVTSSLELSAVLF